MSMSSRYSSASCKGTSALCNPGLDALHLDPGLDFGSVPYLLARRLTQRTSVSNISRSSSLSTSSVGRLTGVRLQNACSNVNSSPNPVPAFDPNPRATDTSILLSTSRMLKMRSAACMQSHSGGGVYGQLNMLATFRIGGGTYGLNRASIGPQYSDHAMYRVMPAMYTIADVR